MKPSRLRAWDWVHTWSSLVCTLFMLLLCVTGLPLIFSAEIDHLSGGRIEAPPMPANTPRAGLDAVVAAAVAAHPGKVPLYVFAEADAPDLWLVKLDDRTDTDESRAVFATIDARTAAFLGQPVFNEGLMHVLYRLHVDLYAGEFGRLFLGAMGLLLLVSLVSGVVLYAPFMRRLRFATVRSDRSPQVRWLDLHNVLSIVTLAWVLVVGATGIINTWANQILQAWQADQMSALRDGVAQRTPGQTPAAVGTSAGLGRSEPSAQSAQSVQPAQPAQPVLPVQRAVDAALAAHPQMKLGQFAFPGTILSTPSHYTVLLRGDEPLTARLQSPVLVEPASGRLVEAAPRPLVVTALQVSQPLHFGDYGGLPLKVVWALLNGVTIAVLWSGLLLWWRKRRAAPGVREAPQVAL